MRVPVLAALLLALALPAGSARAGSIEGVEFADRVSAGDRQLELASMGLLRYRIVFRGYVAALYLPPGVPPEQALQDVPKRLEIEYFWSIRGDAIRDAGEEILARNLDAAKLASLEDGLERIGALYEDVEPGDRYALTYLPGRGTELAKNGRSLGRIEGADFADAYFRIWLGESPIDDSLRDQLLSER